MSDRPHPIECDNIFEADYVGVSVPISKRWTIHQHFPRSFEWLPTQSMILPISQLIKMRGYRQFTNPSKYLYCTFTMPRKTVILNIDGELYHIANTLKMTELVRSGYDIVGIAQMVHPDTDAFSDIIDVPIRCRTTFRNARDYVLYQTEPMPNGFFDPKKPYISVKKVIDPILGNFLTEAIRS